MKKLKITLLFDILIIILFIIFITNLIFINKKSIYNGDETKLCGYISDLYIAEDKLTIEITGDEKVLGYYYFNNSDFINYNFGDNICLFGSLKEVENNRIFNIFNYRKYLLSKNIYYTFSIDKIEKNSDNNKIIYKIKNKIKERILKCEKSFKYLYTFILGDNRYIDDVVMDDYRNIGVSHLFSVSGMHITFISGFILFILNIIIKNHKKKIILLCLIMIFICNIFLTSPSIIRSLLLFLFLSIDKIFNFNQKTIKYFILILLLNLVLNKYLIYNVGFVFSYIISFFLILYQKKIKEITGKIKKSFIISLISFLVSIPILINNFFTINLLTPFFNLIIVPYVSIILFPFSFICLIFPFFDNIYFILINVLEYMVTLFSNISMFNISLFSIPMCFVLLYYFLIIIVINNIFKNRMRYIFILIIVLFFHHNIRNFNFRDNLYFIDVGQGDSVLLTLKNNVNIMIDTGGIVNYNSISSNLVLNKTIPFMNSIGINQLDYLILTHGDYDHMGEAINLVNNFKVEKVIFNCGKFNDLENELIEVLDKEKIPYYSCISELNIDDNKLYFLNNGNYGNENDNSSVIYTELNNHKFLFMGDAGVEVEEDLIEKYNLSDIDVLKVGHHGSKTSSSKEFINEINPKYSIISVGKNNRYGHPNKEALDNLNDSKIYRTDEDGSIMFKIKNKKLKIETCSP